MDQDSAYMVAASKVPMVKPKNGNASLITKVVEGVKTTIAPATAEEKAQKRLELKARSTLLMSIPNEHLKFNFIKDAKSLLQAVEKRFRGNATTKKTQRNLLKQQYGNFTTSSIDVNKPEIDTLSLDDLYNNLKIYELEVKGKSSSNTNTQNVGFVSSNNTNSISGAVNTAHGVTTASTQATAVNSTTIDNLKEIDLRWQIAMLTIRAMRFLKNTGRKFSMNGTDTIGFDKSKVECYNFYKGDTLLWSAKPQEVKIPSTRKTVPVETPALTSLVSCDGLGYNAIPPPYTRNFMPPKLDLSFSGLEEFVNEPIVSETIVKKPVVETSKAKASADKSKVVRKNVGSPLIED
nr:hypothetical protein [Tanacetum cinerariifolium]